MTLSRRLHWLWLLAAFAGVAAAALMALQQRGICVLSPSGGACTAGETWLAMTTSLIVSGCLALLATVAQIICWRRGHATARMAVALLAIAALVVGSAELVGELVERV